MRTTDAATLLEHLYWIRDRVIGAAVSLDASAFAAADTVTSRNLRATLVHELDVQWSWRERLKGADWEAWGEDAELRGEDYATIQAVAEHWERDEAAMREWLARLTDADLDAPPVRGEDRQPLWHYVMHLYSHGLQQFSEAAVLLTRAGHSPGDIGFLEFVQDTGRRMER
ncbi:MAG TPA: DinB family protein [Candidatus Limnocylindria bacterium]|nr:DinB family protein [Candidatus Limnocylindria bacterium]